MKKIALLHYAYPPNTGGVEVLLREHAIILSDLGYEVTVLTGSGKENDPKIKLIEIPEFQSLVKTNPLLYEKLIVSENFNNEFFNFVSKIEEQLNKRLANQDIVIIHNILSLTHNLSFTYALIEYIKKNPLKKFLTWIHDHKYIGSDKTRFHEIKLPNNIRALLTTKIQNLKYITISNTFAKLLKQVIPLNDDELFVVPNGVNPQKFLEIDDIIWDIVDKTDLLHAFPIILYPTNIIERKNIEYSLDILSYLIKDYPLLKFIITGDVSNHKDDLGYLDLLLQRVKKYSLQKNVLFLRNLVTRSLNEAEMHDLYSLADMVLYFSKSENFGIPLIEAFLSKTLIFTSDLKVFHEIAPLLPNYVDVNFVSPEKTAEQIKHCLINNAQFQNGYQARTKYNLKTIIKEQLIPLLK